MVCVLHFIGLHPLSMVFYNILYSKIFLYPNIFHPILSGGWILGNIPYQRNNCRCHSIIILFGISSNLIVPRNSLVLVTMCPSSINYFEVIIIGQWGGLYDVMCYTYIRHCECMPGCTDHCQDAIQCDKMRAILRQIILLIKCPVFQIAKYLYTKIVRHYGDKQLHKLYKIYHLIKL